MTTTGAGPRRAAWLMLGGSAFFTVMGACTHALGPRCDWSLIALTRVAFMGVTTAAVAWASGARLRLWRPRTLWVRSLAGSVSLMCNFYALTALPIGDAATLSNTYPLWIAVLSWLGFGTRARWGELVGVALGLLGVALVQRPHLEEGNLATLAALLASVSTAVAMIGLHKLKDVDARAVVTHFALVGTVAALGFVVARWETARVVLWDQTTAALLVGTCVSGTLAQVMLTKAFAQGAPASVAVVGLSQVAFGAALDVLIWGRSAPATTWLGMAMVLAPTGWMMARRGRPN